MTNREKILNDFFNDKTSRNNGINTRNYRSNEIYDENKCFPTKMNIVRFVEDMLELAKENFGNLDEQTIIEKAEKFYNFL